MVKLNKRIDHDEGDVESSIDWSQLFGENLMNKSSEEKAKHIMEKVAEISKRISDIYKYLN